VELGIDRDLYIPALEAITGIHRSWEDLDKVGERIWNLTRMFWVREVEDFGRTWDMPSPRFYEEPPKTGVTAGQITRYEDVNRLLDMYYEQRGWDPNGIPLPSKLESLNLATVVA
jgi:aldehyde:ferredoxin oxidoreductase